MQNDFEEHVVPVLFYFAENDRGANSLLFPPYRGRQEGTEPL